MKVQHCVFYLFKATSNVEITAGGFSAPARWPHPFPFVLRVDTGVMMEVMRTDARWDGNDGALKAEILTQTSCSDRSEGRDNPAAQCTQTDAPL